MNDDLKAKQAQVEAERFRCRDAFQLMEYTCQGCGKIEMIWNGRNNVSPFCIPCSSCHDDMTHSSWYKDVRIVDYKPIKGQRYFADFTKERAKEYAIARINVFKGTEYETKEGTPKYDELYLELIDSALHGDCMMDIKTAE